MTSLGGYLSDSFSAEELQQHLAKFGVPTANMSRGKLIAKLAQKIIYEGANSPAVEMHHLAESVMNLAHSELVEEATNAGIDHEGSKAAVAVRLVELIFEAILKPESFKDH